MDAIVEAASRVFSESGPRDATTARIAHVAGVSVGSLYQYFPGKTSLFSALVRRLAETDVVRMDRAVERSRGLPLERRLEQLFEACLAPVLERPRLFVWVLTYLPELNLLPVARELEAQLASRLASVLVEHRDELARPDDDPEVLAFAVIGMMRGALIALATHRPEALGDVDRARSFLFASATSGLTRPR